MPIIPRADAHPSLLGLPEERLFEFVDLVDGKGTYAAAAIGDRPGCLELHLTVLRWGPRSAKAMHEDLEWLKQLARSRGKSRIVGLTIAAGIDVDRRWFKFAHAYGFTHQLVHQSAELRLE